MSVHKRPQPTRFRLDPEQLRLFRRQRCWTQAELARRTGFSEDYIGQLERARKTANKGAKLETLVTLAKALQVSVEDLMESDDWNQEQEDGEDEEGIDDADTSRSARHCDQPPQQMSQDLVRRLLLLRPVSGAEPYVPFPRLCGELALKTLVDDADIYVLQSRWLQAEQIGLQARAHATPGSEAWARMTLWYGAQMRQQAGDVTMAEAYLREVEENCLQQVDAVNPLIASMFHITRGWLDLEQYGHFGRALTSLNTALSLMRQYGLTNREWNQRVHGFRFRAISEIAITECAAWIGAWPTHPLRSSTSQYLQESLQDDHQIALDLDPENPNTFYRRAIVDALLHPADAQRTHRRLFEMAQQTGTEHIWALHVAKWRFSEKEWELAQGHAEEAFYGYGNQGFPPGTAWAAAVAGQAILRNGITRARAFQRCADYLLLALMLHPYVTHPLFRITRHCLMNVMGCLEYESWLRAYGDQLEGRIANGDGPFNILDHIKSEAVNGAIPLQFVRSLSQSSTVAHDRRGHQATCRSITVARPINRDDSV